MLECKSSSKLGEVFRVMFSFFCVDLGVEGSLKQLQNGNQLFVSLRWSRFQNAMSINGEKFVFFSKKMSLAFKDL